MSEPKLTEGARAILTAQGTLGVGAALPRPEPKEKTLRTRLIECRNGHGVIGQVWIESMKHFAGACPTCGDQPEQE